MSNEIIKVLDNLGQKFGIAIDWTSQNILPYLQDLMNRFISLQSTKAIIWIVILSVLVIATIILMVIGIRVGKREDDEEIIFMAVFIGIIILICLVVPLICNIFGLMQNIYTPELTLLEYITNYGEM